MGSTVTSRLVLAAASAVLPAAVAPSATSRSTALGSTSYTVSASPERIMLRAMAKPILPRPTKPTLSLSAELASVRRRPPVTPTVTPSLWPRAPRPAQERTGAARAHPRSSRMPCAMGAGLVERAHAGTGQVGWWG